MIFTVHFRISRQTLSVIYSLKWVIGSNTCRAPSPLLLLTKYAVYNLPVGNSRLNFQVKVHVDGLSLVLEIFQSYMYERYVINLSPLFCKVCIRPSICHSVVQFWLWLRMYFVCSSKRRGFRESVQIWTTSVRSGWKSSCGPKSALRCNLPHSPTPNSFLVPNSHDKKYEGEGGLDTQEASGVS